MLTRIVLDYVRDEYIFPDGRVIQRSIPLLLDGGFTVRASSAEELFFHVEALAKDIRGRTPTHYQVYEISHASSTKVYSVYFFSLTQEPHVVSDEDQFAWQSSLYKLITA